jgi:hypothetical protein
VAHTYIPSYSGSRNQEDRGSKPAGANSSVRPYLKKTHHKERGLVVAQGVGPEFKSQYRKEKKRNTICHTLPMYWKVLRHGIQEVS